MSDAPNLIRESFRSAAPLSQVLAAAIACIAFSGAVRAQVAAPDSATPASGRNATTGVASVSGGAPGTTQTTELQRRTELSHRRRSMQMEAANEQLQQLLAANQELPATVTHRHHRAEAGHRGTTAQGRPAARRTARTIPITGPGDSTP